MNVQGFERMHRRRGASDGPPLLGPECARRSGPPEQEAWGNPGRGDGPKTRRTPSACWIAAVLAMLILVASAPAQPQRNKPLIEQALDESAEINLESLPLGDALRKISEQTGIKIIVPPETMELAPQGADTVVQRVEISNVPLREGLAQFLAPLGMTFQVQGAYLVVIPEPALQCLGRPPTWDELDVLSDLRSMRPGVRADDLQRLREMVQFQLPVPDAWSILAGAVRSVGAGAGDEVLAIACGNLGWAWCLSGHGIAITSYEQQIRSRLQQPISFRMNNVPLIDVLAEIGRHVGVAVHTEPGALASLPLYIQKNFSLNVQQTSGEEVLEKIVATTGLAYSIQPDGVYFTLTGGPPTQTEGFVQEQSERRTRDPYVGKIVVELEGGKSIEWFIRSSELPPDLRQRREEDLQAAFEALRKQVD